MIKVLQEVHKISVTSLMDDPVCIYFNWLNFNKKYTTLRLTIRILFIRPQIWKRHFFRTSLCLGATLKPILSCFALEKGQEQMKPK